MTTDTTPDIERRAQPRTRQDQLDLLRRRAQELRANTSLLDATYARLAARYGVALTEWDEAPELAGVDLCELCEGLPVSELVELAEAFGDGELAGVDLEERDGEIGVTGTRVVGGLISVEPTARLRPYLARGVASNHGVFDKHAREPRAYKALQSIRELLISGDWDVSGGEVVSEAQAPVLDEALAWVRRWLFGVLDWEQYAEDAATAISHGFCPFEVVWGEDDAGRPHPRKVALREPSTVERWCFDERGDALQAVRFRVGGDATTSYVLPATGEALADQRVLVVTLGGRGNNLEGIAPLRVVDTIITLKELVWKIMAASSERFGCPVLTTRFDPALLSLPNIAVNDDELDDFLEFMALMMALDTPAASIPQGLLLEYIYPQGSAMPDFLGIVEHLDSAIDHVFSTQAMGLGQRSAHGSYALAEVQDSDLRRAIPYYARVIAKPLNRIIRRLLAEVWGLELVRWPRLIWSEREVLDASRWISDALAVAAAAPSLPEPVLARSCELLGLPPDVWSAPQSTATVEPSTALEGAPPVQADQPVQDRAFNGAQAATRGEVSRESAIAMLEVLFQLGRAEAARIVDTAPAAAPPTPEPEPLT